MATHRRNSALKFFVNGRRAQQLDGLADLAGNALSAYDVAVTRAVVGLKRRAVPTVSRQVRKHYNVKAGSLREKYRVESRLQGTKNDRDEYLSIWASTRQIPLLDFRGRWSGRKSKGATANISGQAKTYESAFIATVKGLRAIRARSFESTGRRAGRGPLRMLYGPSPFEMVAGLEVPGRTHQPSLNTKQAVLSELRVFYTTELRRQWRMARGN